MRYASIAILFLASTLSAAMYETRSPHHLLTLDRVADGSYDVKLTDTDTNEVLASAHLAPTNPPTPMESAFELRDMRITLRVMAGSLEMTASASIEQGGMITESLRGYWSTVPRHAGLNVVGAYRVGGDVKP